MDQKSKEFEKSFLDCLRYRHMTAKVNANNVYQEVISDKTHVHMNATIWTTLGDFCKYLGKTGKCTVEETERGWMIAYIERNVQKLEQEEQTRKRLEAEQRAEVDALNRLEMQRQEAALALDRAGGNLHIEATGREETGTAVQVAIKRQKTHHNKLTTAPTNTNVFQDDDDDDEEDRETTSTTIEKIEERKETPTTWLMKDILVRIISKQLDNGKWFQRKAIVDRVVGTKAQVTILDSGPKTSDGGQEITVSQDDLETVVPKQAGKRVKLLRGTHRGQSALVQELKPHKYRARLELESTGEVLKRVHYDDFSKMV